VATKVNLLAKEIQLQKYIHKKLNFKSICQRKESYKEKTLRT
jgi:hypothetical protein